MPIDKDKADAYIKNARIKHVSIDRDGMGTIEVTPPTDHLDPAHAPVPHAHMDEH